MYTVCGMCKKISKCSLLLSSKWFLGAAGNGASENAVYGSLLFVVSPPLPNYFSHMVKHLSVSKQSCILSSTTCSLLACSQISSHKIARYVLCYSPSSFLIQDYRIWFHLLSWSDCRVWCRKCINLFCEVNFTCQQDASRVLLLLTRISDWLLLIVPNRLTRENAGNVLLLMSTD